jgi:signal transduction histidine kinase
LALRSGERARQLIRQLLFFSRGDSRKTTGAIALVPQIEDIVSMLKPMLSAKIDVPTELPESALAVKY